MGRGGGEVVSVLQGLLLFLIRQRPRNMLVDLRELCAQTTVRAATLN